MQKKKHGKYNPEKVLDDHPQPIGLEQIDIIKQKMEKSICKIKCPKVGFGTGFFCKIPFPNEFNLLPVLITNNHVLDEEDIMAGKKCEFSLNNDKLNFQIFFHNNRKTYTNKEYDITIIELKLNDDGLKGYSFLEYDDNIFIDDPKKYYKKKTIYLIHYPNGQKVEFSNGVIKNIFEDNYTISHLCITKSRSSGGPLINLLNHKVIGVHKGSILKQEFNLGTLLKIPIQEFNQKYQNSNNNNQLPIKNNNLSYSFNNKNSNNMNFNNNNILPFMNFNYTPSINYNGNQIMNLIPEFNFNNTNQFRNDLPNTNYMDQSLQEAEQKNSLIIPNIIFKFSSTGKKMILSLPNEITGIEMKEKVLCKCGISSKNINDFEFIYNARYITNNEILKNIFPKGGCCNIDIIEKHSVGIIMRLNVEGKLIIGQIYINEIGVFPVHIGTLNQIKYFYKEILKQHPDFRNGIIYPGEIKLNEDDERTFLEIGIQDNFICKFIVK